MSSISASIGKSLSIILMVSPILKGNEKNKIIPAVILLKIDHIAKKATPTIVSTDEMTKKICSLFTPQIAIKEIAANTLANMFIYLETKTVLDSEKPDFSLIFLINEVKTTLRTTSMTRVITVAIIC